MNARITQSEILRQMDIETYTREDGARVTLWYDIDTDNPLRDWDHAGVLVFLSRPYSRRDLAGFGDEDAGDLEDWIEDTDPAGLCIPIYDVGGNEPRPSAGEPVELVTTMDEDGDTRTVGAKPDSWDGCIGLWYFDPATLAKVWGDYDDPDPRGRAKDHATRMLQAFRTWADSEVVGYTVETPSTCDHCKHTVWTVADSCGGFFSIEDARTEAGA